MRVHNTFEIIYIQVCTTHSICKGEEVYYITICMYVWVGEREQRYRVVSCPRPYFSGIGCGNIVYIELFQRNSIITDVNILYIEHH